MTPPEVITALGPVYPEAKSELTVWSTPFQFLVCVVLSAQSTDIAVNALAPRLFTRYPDIKDFAQADPSELENAIRKVGLANFKARNLIACARALLNFHKGTIPQTLRELVALPGIGRKTANVILDTLFHRHEGIVIDTHGIRLSGRMGFTTKIKPHQVEKALMDTTPQSGWGTIGHLLTWHGRRRCFAINPDCAGCELSTLCPKIGAMRTQEKDPPRLYV